MTGQNSKPLRVLIAGAGVAGLETLLALRDLAGERVAVTMLAPNREFVYRPMTVREPFAYAPAGRYEVAPIIAEAGAELVVDRLGWVDADRRVVHTAGGSELEYDALVLALGARISPRYEFAVTIDDGRLDDALHGLIQDVEGGYVHSVAFVAPGRMAWPLPIYELAMMTAGRAYDMGVELDTTIVTPEDSPLAIFGAEVSREVAALLDSANVATITSAYAEVPKQGEIVINPGDRRLHVDRVVALPELYGPSVRGLPSGEHGFIAVNRFGRLPSVAHVFAAGDAVEFPVKHGGLGAQEADVVAESIAALVGVPITPKPFKPVIHGVLLTHEQPRYITAEITGGDGFSSQFSETPPDEPAHKIAARFLAPYLQRLDSARAAA